MPRLLTAAALALLLAGCNANQAPHVPMWTGATSPPPAALSPASETIFGE